MTSEYILNREVDRVLAVLTPGNALVVRAMLETGLRIGDALALRYDRIGNNFWITEAKTGKRRHVGMSSALVDDIREAAAQVIPPWALALEGSLKNPPLWAFPSPRDWKKARTRQAVWKDIKRAAKAFRITQNVCPHTFRKVYAVQLLAKYGDIKRVQRALNHSNATVTAIYAMADSLVDAGRGRKAPAGSGRR